jgi:hypothetical protein
MRHLRLLIIALAAVCVMGLGAFAFVTTGEGGDDDIIIKGGSIEIQCGKNHKKDCFGTPDLYTGKYKRGDKDDKHIRKVVVKRTDGTVVFNSELTPIGDKPEIAITYK